jgi:hypothetical protein
LTALAIASIVLPSTAAQRSAPRKEDTMDPFILCDACADRGCPVCNDDDFEEALDNEVEDGISFAERIRNAAEEAAFDRGAW